MSLSVIRKDFNVYRIIQIAFSGIEKFILSIPKIRNVLAILIAEYQLGYGSLFE